MRLKIHVGPDNSCWTHHEGCKEDAVTVVTLDEIEALIVAARKYRVKTEETAKASIGIFFHAANHGMPYTGPTWEAEGLALDEALNALESK